jgi:broad specificity polyphosphatase/5'/3'-nucleotidase SurE
MAHQPSAGLDHPGLNRNRPMSDQPIYGTDIWALRNNFISITPLQFSLGRQEQVPEIEGLWPIFRTNC